MSNIRALCHFKEPMGISCLSALSSGARVQFISQLTTGFGKLRKGGYMATTQATAIYKFIKIPIPIGTAGAFIWAFAAFIQKWDPKAYPDLKTVFALPGMQIYTAVVVLTLVAYYCYTGFDWVRLTILRGQVRIAEHRNPPPAGMVLVPSGPFVFRLKGSRVHLNGFFIDKNPVTNEQYMEFVRETGYPHPPSWKNGCYPDFKSRHPVVAVSWDDAQRYCKWRSSKTGFDVTLPTEQEWEKAARGPYGFCYPWGNSFNAERCNVGLGPHGDTKRVNAFPEGKSPYGCWDMCGNVWEWTDSWFDESESIAVLKGGSYYFDEEFSVLWIRYHDPKTDHWPDLGFRCAIRL
jgi:sulfatase modifying factor 1